MHAAHHDIGHPSGMLSRTLYQIDHAAMRTAGKQDALALVVHNQALFVGKSIGYIGIAHPLEQVFAAFRLAFGAGHVGKQQQIGADLVHVPSRNQTRMMFQFRV